MISITMLFFKYYKQIILLISIIPILFLIYGMYKFSLKKIIISIAIIIVLLISFFYLTKREPSSKYAAKTVVHLDEKLKQCDNLLKNYDGLNTKLYDEVKKLEAEIKEDTESLNLTKEEKEKVKKQLEDNEDKIKDIKEKCKYIEKNICILNGQLIDLEKQKEQKEKEIKQKEDQLAKEQDEVVRKQLLEEITKLEEERGKIIQKIVDLKKEIDILESKKKMYNGMLLDAERLKNQLEKRYIKLTDDEKGLLSQITTRKDRLKQIQDQIETNNKNKIELQKKIDTIRLERAMAEACRLACDNWDAEHDFSWGNFSASIFEGFDKVAEFTTDKQMLKATSNTTKKFTGFAIKTIFTVRETQKIINSLKQTYFDDNGNPKKMSKETYDSIVSRTDGEWKDLKDKFDKCEAKTNQLLENQKPENLNKAEDDEAKQIINIQEENRLVLVEYQKTVNVLEEELAKTGDSDYKKEERKEKEEQNNQLKELIEANKNQLKQKSPSFNARDNHVKNMRYTRWKIKR